MTLEEIMAERKNRYKSEVIQCVEKDYHAVPMITLCPWQESEWVLPWSRLDAMRFSDVENSEQVELFFPHHHVVVVGENLRQFDEAFRTYMINCLRSMPAAHRASLKPTAPFIARLEVRVLADPKGGPAVDVPF
jgi:hypothetical protein